MSKIIDFMTFRSYFKKRTERVVYNEIQEFKQKLNKEAENIRNLLQNMANGKVEIPKFPIQPPQILPGVVPKGATAPVMAADNIAYSFFGDNFCNYGGYGYPGYQYLAELTTRPEYRAFSDANALEITREWITIHSTSADKADKEVNKKIEIIEQKLKELDLRNTIKLAAEHVDWFGRAQLFIDIEGANRAIPLIMTSNFIPKGSLKGVYAVEPVWTTPSYYNAIDPGQADFYKPHIWFMMGYEVSATRLLTIVTRVLPDLLKPAFNFSGISLSQLAQPYVEIWLRTRQSIADLINNFSILALKTNMAQILQDGDSGQSILNRARLFTQTRSNQGLMLLDMNTEELTQLAVPLAGLSELQSQAQQHMCTVAGIPAVKLLGIAPSGFNASADDEIRVFYDKKRAEQESYWRKPIETVIKLIMLSEFGEIDDTIGFTFNPLWQMSAKEKAEVGLMDSQAAGTYIQNGVLSNIEVREAIARDPESGFNGIDVEDTADLVPPDLGNTEKQEQQEEPYAEATSEGQSKAA
jgi:phage-related protein (TIGR01555 family)